MDKKSLTISINGNPGSGKSTLAWFIKELMEFNNVHAKIHSIEYDDDEYQQQWFISRKDRIEQLRKSYKKIISANFDDSIRIYQTFHRSVVSNSIINVCIHSKFINDEDLDDIVIMFNEIFVFL